MTTLLRIGVLASNSNNFYWLNSTTSVTPATVVSDIDGNATVFGYYDGLIAGYKLQKTGAFENSIGIENADAVSSFQITSAAISSSGNVYATFYWEDETSLSQFGVVKFDSSWNIVWQKKGLTQGTIYSSLVINETLYVGGSYDTTGKYFLAKFDEDGTLLWSKTIAVDVDTNGQVFKLIPYGSNILIAISSGNGTFGSNVLEVTSEGLISSFKKKFVSNVSGFAIVKGIVKSSDGYVYVLINNTISSVTNSVLIKMQSNGALVWQKKLQQAYSNLLIDSLNNLYVLGTYDTKLWIHKYNPTGSGSIVWTRTLKDNSDISPGGNPAISVDAVYALNSVTSRLSFNGAGLGTYTVGSESITYDTESWTETEGALVISTPSASFSNLDVSIDTASFSTSAGPDTSVTINI